MRWIRSLVRNNNTAEAAPEPARPQIYSDDCFLVSYPKSGNTWMRFLLANLLKTEDPGTPEIDFHSAVDYVPEYEVHTQSLDSAPRPRMLKSHAPFDPSFPKVAYLVRDPRDVYVSYFHYMRKRLPQGTSFGGFLRLEDLHPCHWHEHVAGWIDQPNVQLIRYEDMLADTRAQLRKFIDFWGGRTFSDEQIDRAVEASSFERMKALEKQNGRPFKDEVHQQRSTTFMRKGQSGDWVNYFDRADLEYLSDRCGKLMQRLGYHEKDTLALAG